MPVYTYEGTETNNAYDYESRKLDAVYDYEGVKIELEDRPMPTDISALFKDKKFALIGDSNFDISFTQHSSIHAQQIVGDALRREFGTYEQYYFVSDGDSRKNTLAKGGHGFTAPLESCYYHYVRELQDDLDLVIFQISPNDWKFKDTIKALSDQEWASVSGNQYALMSIKNPSDDIYPTNNTAAGYITKTLYDAHEKCPNARIVVLGAFIYPIGSMTGYRNKYYHTMTSLCSIIIDDMITNKGCSWLSPMYDCWYHPTFDKSGRSYTNITPRTTSDARVFSFDECISGFDGESFDMNKIDPVYGSVEYRDYYTSAIDNKHLGINCHREFVAPWLGHILAKEFQKIEGTSFTDDEINNALPSELKWNN